MENEIDIQKERERIIKKYKDYTLQDKIDLIAQTFHAKTGKIYIPSRKPWILIKFDNNIKLEIGKKSTHKEEKDDAYLAYLIDDALSEYCPESVEITKKWAYDILKKQEAQDNELAMQHGMKARNLLSVEMVDNDNFNLGKYYLKLTVGDKERTLMEGMLHIGIKNGDLGWTLRHKDLCLEDDDDEEPDFIFCNVGYSSTSDSYRLLTKQEYEARYQTKR